MSEPGSTPSGLQQPDASQRSAGQLLRAERERQGLTVEALSAIIKVAPGRIQALESDQLARVADANFTRALAQTVCRALKIDPAPVLRALPPAEPARLHEAHAPLNQPLPQRRGGLSKLSLGTSGWRSLSRHRLLVPLLILLAAAVVYGWPDSMPWQFGPWGTSSERASPSGVSDSKPAEGVAGVDGEGAEAQVGTQPPDTAVPFAEPPGVSASVAAPASQVASASAPEATQSGGAAPVAPGGVPPLSLDPANAPVGNGRVGLSVREPAWVDVREAVSGRKVFSRLVQAGESLEVEGQPPLRVRVGNAPAVSLRYGGQPIDLAPHTRNNVARLELK